MGRSGTLPLVSTEKLPSGRWRAVVRYGGVKRTSATFATRDEARTAEAQLLLAMQTDMGPVGRRPVGAESVTVGELLELHAGRADFSATYAADHQRIRARLPDKITRAVVANVTPMHVIRWWPLLTQQGWKPSRIDKAHTVLSSAFSEAVRLGLVTRNPVRDVGPPHAPTREIQPPDEATVATLLDEANTDAAFGAFVELVADTGMRRGELLGVRWGDLALRPDGGSVVVRRSVAYTPATGVIVKDTKTGRRGRRTIRLSERCSLALAIWKIVQAERLDAESVRPEAYVFSATGDEPRRPDWASQRWTRLCADVGISCRLHDIRHYVATRDIREHGIVFASRKLGHSRMSTTADIYAHLQEFGID